MDFTLGLDKDSRITFISTSDENFQTPEGITIGSPLTTAVELSEMDVVAEHSWVWYVKLPSRWCAALGSEVFEDGEVRKCFYPEGDIELPNEARMRWFYSE